MEPKKYKVMLIIAGGFYALLCVFSIVVGLMYATGQHELNTIELSESMLEKLSDPEALHRFTASRFERTVLEKVRRRKAVTGNF